MSKIQKEQDTGYSAHSEHFHHTRKKRRPEVEHLFESMRSRDRTVNSSPFSVVDIGCGSGRLAPLLRETFPTCTYRGVDSAQGMVEQASKNYADYTFINDDMIGYMAQQEQESIDCVIALASFQHVQGSQDHHLALTEIYKSLSRGGRCYLVNWSFSDRFLKKYRRNCCKAIVRSLWKSGWSWNDVIIPWKDSSYHKNGKKFDRMYHMFGLHELETIAKASGFVIKESYFVGQDGKKTSNWRHARNSFIVLEKALSQ